MMSPELLCKIKQLEIHTRRLAASTMMGARRSARKGTGLEFDQIREYQVGDDVRFIDWKSSARMNKLLIKEYIEERSRNIVIALDISRSGDFSSQEDLKKEMMAQIASVLAFVGHYGRDFVSLILFSSEIEYEVSAGSSMKHIQRIIEKAFTYQARSSQTDIPHLFKHIIRRHAKNSLVCVISDFIDTGFEKSLAIAAQKTELIAIRCLDKHEQFLPPVGMIMIQDPETGLTQLVDTRNVKVKQLIEHRVKDQNALFKRYRVDYFDVHPSKPFIAGLIKFFRRRMQY